MAGSCTASSGTTNSVRFSVAGTNTLTLPAGTNVIASANFVTNANARRTRARD